MIIFPAIMISENVFASVIISNDLCAPIMILDNIFVSTIISDDLFAVLDNIIA